MFTVYQLMQKINTEYPNNGFVYDDTVEYDTQVEQAFIDYINSALARLGRDVLLDDVYQFETAPGQLLYELPINCEMRNILEVTVQAGQHLIRRLKWTDDSEHLQVPSYFNGYGHTIGIASGLPGRRIINIYYKRTPRPVKTKDDPIEMQDRWIDILTYSVIVDMASGGSNPDIELSNNYTLKLNNLLQQEAVERYKDKAYYPRIKDNKRPPISFYRRGYRCY